MENEINTTGFEIKKRKWKMKSAKISQTKKSKIEKRKECWKRSIKFEINICDDDCDVLN